MKKGFIEIAVNCTTLDAAEALRQEMVMEGVIAPNSSASFSVTDSTHKLMEALVALDDMREPDSLLVLNLIDRLLADDWTGTGVYEGLGKLLGAAESLVKPGTLSQTM